MKNNSLSDSRRIQININRKRDGSGYTNERESPVQQKVNLKRLEQENSYLHDESKYLRKRVENLEEMVNHSSVNDQYNTSGVWSNGQKASNNRERSTGYGSGGQSRYNDKLKGTIKDLEGEIEELRIENRRLRVERSNHKQDRLRSQKSNSKGSEFKVNGGGQMGDFGQDGEKLLLHNFLLSVEVKRLHKLLRRMAAHCEDIENKQRSGTNYDLKLPSNLYSSTRNGNTQDLENNLMELTQTVKLQDNKLVLKDRYLEEQRKLLDEMNVTQQTIVRSLEKQHKEKLDQLYDKINMLRADKNELIRDFDDMVVNKDREIERVKTNHENFKMAHCKH